MNLGDRYEHCTNGLRDGLWHHVAATYDPNSGYVLYVDSNPTNDSLSYNIEQAAGPTADMSFTPASGTDIGTGNYHSTATINSSGVYTIKITASDPEKSANDEITFTVNAAPLTNDELRSRAVTTIIKAFEKYALTSKSFLVNGAGFQGTGDGYYHLEDGESLPKSFANASIVGGHLSDPAPQDPLYTPGETTNDFLVYVCDKHVGIFAYTSALTPAADATNF